MDLKPDLQCKPIYLVDYDAYILVGVQYFGITQNSSSTNYNVIGFVWSVPGYALMLDLELQSFE